MKTIAEPKSGPLRSFLFTIANPFRFAQQRMLAESEDDAAVLLQASCMTVIDILERPGTVQATATHLILRPCIGKAKRIPFSDIREAAQTRWFNGTKRFLGFQHGFWIKGAGYARLGFAVTNAGPWQDLFREHGIDS